MLLFQDETALRRERLDASSSGCGCSWQAVKERALDAKSRTETLILDWNLRTWIRKSLAI